MGDLNGARWKVEFKVAGSVAGEVRVRKGDVLVKGGENIRGERVDLLLIG